MLSGLLPGLRKPRGRAEEEGKPTKANFSLQIQAKRKTKKYLPPQGDEPVWCSRQPRAVGGTLVPKRTPQATTGRFSNKEASVGQSWAIAKEEIEVVKVTGK